MPKNWCFWTVVLEKTLASPLDCKEIQPVHSKGDQPWDFFGKNDTKAETPILWPPHAKSWLIGKDPDAGRDWGQEKGKTEDKMAGWHHWLDGHESEWTSGVGDGQGGLACYDSWGHKESDTTERLNWTENNLVYAKDQWFLMLFFYLHPHTPENLLFLTWVPVWVLIIQEAKVIWRFETVLGRARKENGRGMTYEIAHLLILSSSKKSLFQWVLVTILHIVGVWRHHLSFNIHYFL